MELERHHQILLDHELDTPCVLLPCSFSVSFSFLLSACKDVVLVVNTIQQKIYKSKPQNLKNLGQKHQTGPVLFSPYLVEDNLNKISSIPLHNFCSNCVKIRHRISKKKTESDTEEVKHSISCLLFLALFPL